MTSAGASTDPAAPAGDRFLLGVDGGGSKTEAWLARAEADGPQVIGRGQAGSSNLRAIGADRALENLHAAIVAARREAGCTAPIETAVLALAGSANREVRAALDQWCANEQVARRARVVHDARPVIAAGTREDWGVALIAGTGSSAYAIDASRQQTAIAGGWGYLFGDEGSGFWIGREALRRVSRAADRRDQATALTAALQDLLKVADPRELLSALSLRGDLRQATAALAPTVLACADEGDAVALAIVDSAAEELAQLAAAAARGIGTRRAFPLALAGGVLVKNAMLREKLLGHLAACDCIPAAVDLVAHPVAGCLRMAQETT